MGSELDLVARDVDIDAFVAAARALALLEPGLSVEVTETPFDGPATTIWGRVLPADDDEVWAEAQEEADGGLGTIETIRPIDGAPRFDAFVYDGPYRAAVLAGLERDGRPVFEHRTSFVALAFGWAGGRRLVIHLDRATRQTGHPAGERLVAGRSATLLSTGDEYVGRDADHATAEDHIRAVRLAELLAAYGSVETYDPTGYVEHRDEVRLVAAMALDRQFRADLRRVLAGRAVSTLPDADLAGLRAELWSDR